MGDAELNMLISRSLQPSYYDDFMCTGGDCRITCCQKWGILFNRKEYLSLKKLKYSPKLTKRMEHALKRLKTSNNEKDAFFARIALKDGVCPILSESGLCDLQLEKGYKSLPFVCRFFPRRELYNHTGYLEYSLSTACEAVLQQLWDMPDGIEFRTSALNEDKIRNFFIENPTPLLTHSYDIKNLCIKILQDRRLPLPQRIILMGARLQEITKKDADVSAWIAKTNALLSDSEAILKYKSVLANSEQAKTMYISSNLKTLSLIINTGGDYDDYRVLMDTLILENIHNLVLNNNPEMMFTDGSEIVIEKNSDIIVKDTYDISFDMSIYSEAESAFSEIFKDKEYFFENLAVTLLFHMKIPNLNSENELWKSYMNFCSLYSIFHFVSVLSTKTQLPIPPGNSKNKAPIPGSKEALFQVIVIISRALLHSEQRSDIIRDEFFKNNSSTLAHMAILVSG